MNLGWFSGICAVKEDKVSCNTNSHAYMGGDVATGCFGFGTIVGWEWCGFYHTMVVMLMLVPALIDTSLGFMHCTEKYVAHHAMQPNP